MAGLILIGAIVGWSYTCLAIAAYISKKVSLGWRRKLTSLVLPPVLFLLPISNHFVGWLQYEHFCEATNYVTFLGVVQAPKELYSDSGKWLLGEKMDSSRWKEGLELVKLADSVVWWDHGNYIPISKLTYVGKRNTKIYEKASGRLVAEWTSHSFSGGLGGLMGVTRECRPDLLNQDGYRLYEKLFVRRDGYRAAVAPD